MFPTFGFFNLSAVNMIYKTTTVTTTTTATTATTATTTTVVTLTADVSYIWCFNFKCC
jgi:hypothetical protein